MQADERNPNGGRILLVDDREESRYMVGRVLRKAGYEVHEAVTGAQALELCGLDPALVILDINLPDTSGLEICRRIKADPTTSSLLVVHLSASFVSKEDQVTGLSAGADGYLTHPVDAGVLLATVGAFMRIRRAEEGLRQAKAELERTVELRNADIEALKLERDLRETFVATLTHDLRNPLAAAKMSAEMIRRHPLDDAARIRTAQRAIQSVERADRMIQDLLDASSIRAGQSLPVVFGEFDLAQLVGQVATDAETVHGKRVEVRLGPQAAPVRGRWDIEAIRRVLDNLLSNAFKYGSQAGPVTVAVAEREGRAELSVHNPGPPIPASDLPRLFDRYHRTDSARGGRAKGWGLGLTLVQGIARAHGGTIEVTSAESVGTTFTVRLPLDPGSSSP